MAMNFVPKIAAFQAMQTPDRQELLSKLADASPECFDALAMQVFHRQAKSCALFEQYLHLLGRSPERITSVPEIPYVPVGLFKSHHIQSGNWNPETYFTSSSTTGQTPSRHAVRNLDFYLQNTRRGFSQFYGDPSEWCVLALLPSYLERTGSSLVAMADYFIRLSRHPKSGFFLYNFDELGHTLQACQDAGTKTLLLGVSHALLDFAEQHPMNLSGITIMETGGMKGRRREITRQELHETLCNAFSVPGIHSEYGMTELFSQAYSLPTDAGKAPRFMPASTLRAIAFELYDPLCPALPGRTGVLAFADLANVDTCSFIATEDLGKVYPDGSFEVLGRLDAAELRGCNLMVE